MRIKLFGLMLGLTFIAALFPAVRASAHVLIADETNTVGAILHLTPDDDPVAGTTTGIFYDVQTPIDLNNAAVHLQITNAEETISESVVTTREGSTASGAFIFPIRGLYYLTLSISSRAGGPEVKPLTFRSSVRITRSLSGRDPKPETPAWATFGLIMSVWGLSASLLVLAVRHRTIFRQSK
jgi:disulfide bond formation protein DsbB